MAACRTFVFVLLGLFVSYRSSWQSHICDDGKYKIEKDLGGDSNHQCLLDSKFGPDQFIIPAGEGNCTTHHVDILSLCMGMDLHYKQSPPTIGHYRSLPPEPGEYDYLPPQRWLQLLRRGGVAFLYHPCADEEQVEELRRVAQSCLNYYVMTPYPNMTKVKPLAVVTWGCIYSMEWVHPVEIKEWLMLRKLKLDNDYGGTSYNHGLLPSHEAVPVKSLCSSIHSSNNNGKTTTASSTATPKNGKTTTASSTATPTTGTLPPVTASSPCPPKSSNRSRSLYEERLCDEHHEVVKKLLRHSTSLLVLSVLLGGVLLGFMLLLLWKAAATWSHGRPRKHHKYKSVSKYFPFTHKDSSVNVALPEFGMPKGMGAERQVLLEESEDDEL